MRVRWEPTSATPKVAAINIDSSRKRNFDPRSRMMLKRSYEGRVLRLLRTIG